jgi:hypothetical protein
MAQPKEATNTIEPTNEVHSPYLDGVKAAVESTQRTTDLLRIARLSIEVHQLEKQIKHFHSLPEVVKILGEQREDKMQELNRAKADFIAKWGIEALEPPKHWFQFWK